MNIIERYQLLNNGKIILPPVETSLHIKKIFVLTHGATSVPITEWVVPENVRIFIYTPIGMDLIFDLNNIPLFCRSDTFIKDNVYRIYNPGSKIYNMNLNTKTLINNSIQPFILACQSGIKTKLISITNYNKILLSELIDLLRIDSLFYDYHFISCRSHENVVQFEEPLERMSTLSLYNLPWTESIERDRKYLPDELEQIKRQMVYTGYTDFPSELPEERPDMFKIQRKEFKLTKEEKRRIVISKQKNNELIRQRTKRNELLKRFRNPVPMVFPETLPFEYKGPLEYRNPFGKNQVDITYLKSL